MPDISQIIINSCEFFHLKYICPYQDMGLNANSPRSLEAKSGGLQSIQGKHGLHIEHVSKTNK